MYKIDMMMEIQLTVWHNAKIFNTVRMQDYYITDIVVKMDTVGLMCERYNSGFMNINKLIIIIPV
jgi:hypothetical protein